MDQSDNNAVREKVRERYAGIALENGAGCGCSSSCCSPQSQTAGAQSAGLGYSSLELDSVPEGADMGLGCGNPQAIAMLKEGETVLDLGCGGGFDCFLASKRVGESGRVIGVDMTAEMIRKARKNARQGSYANVEFRLGEIEHLPVADNSVDAIMSNCVINLSPDKRQVYSEAYRVLKKEGRLAISDVVAVRNIPQEVKDNLDKYSGCVAGAATVGEIERMLHAAGFREIRIDVKEDSKHFIKDWFPDSGVENYVSAAAIQARK